MAVERPVVRAFVAALAPLGSGDGVTLVPRPWLPVPHVVAWQVSLGLDRRIIYMDEHYELLSRDSRGLRLYRMVRNHNETMVLRPVPERSVTLSVSASHDAQQRGVRQRMLHMLPYVYMYIYTCIYIYMYIPCVIQACLYNMCIHKYTYMYIHM